MLSRETTLQASAAGIHADVCEESWGGSGGAHGGLGKCPTSAKTVVVGQRQTDTRRSSWWMQGAARGHCQVIADQPEEDMELLLKSPHSCSALGKQKSVSRYSMMIGRD